MQMANHTVDIVRKFEWGNSILDVNIEDVVVLFPLVKLLASRADGINDFPYFLPLITRAIPLIYSLAKRRIEGERNILGALRLLHHSVPF